MEPLLASTALYLVNTSSELSGGVHHLVKEFLEAVHVQAGLGFGVWGLESGVWGLGSRVWVLRSGVWDMGHGV